MKYFIFSLILLFSACSDDLELASQASPNASLQGLNSQTKTPVNANKSEITIDGTTISLKKAKLYLTRDIVFDVKTNVFRPYRSYVISDGTYTNASGTYGWLFSDYTNATYVLIFEIYAPQTSLRWNDVYTGWNGGDYPVVYDWLNYSDNSNIGYIWMVSGVDNYPQLISQSGVNNYILQTTDEAVYPLQFNGGMNNGEKLTISFDGKLFKDYWDGSNLTYKNSTVKIHVEATVN
jgi:hypothetical protein